MATITVTAKSSLLGPNISRQFELSDDDMRDILNWARRRYARDLAIATGQYPHAGAPRPPSFITDDEVMSFLAQKWLTDLAEGATVARRDAAIQRASFQATQHALANTREIKIG